MSSKDYISSIPLRVLSIFLVFKVQCMGLNTDGLLLLSFKLSIVTDPFNVLRNWNYTDATPCSWAGVTCREEDMRVTGLSLQSFGLLGPIPSTVGMVEHLRVLDLSNNSINGSFPSSLFKAYELQRLDLSNNLISGFLPELVGNMTSLQVLNLSDNTLSGQLPRNLSVLRNLTTVSLKNNYFYGSLPGGFESVKFMDLSSNLIDGSLPWDFGGSNLGYLNVSFNRLSGEIPERFADKIPANATIDISFNNLTGPIPKSNLFSNQDVRAYSGNPKLCGPPLKTLCSIPSTVATNPDSPPAIAAIPKTIDSSPETTSPGSVNQGRSNRLRTSTILGIVIGDVAGIAILVLVFMYVYTLRKRRTINKSIRREAESAIDERHFDWASSESSPEEYKWLRNWTCLKKQRHARDGEDNDVTSDTTSSDESQDIERVNQETQGDREQKNGALVTVDGEKELELETLLKASAYILGASGSSIMYKAVLEDGTTLAVRRVGETGLERFRDFENQVRAISKLVHPNLVKIRGFYWGDDEKLIIYDFVPNGSLANARFSRKPGSSSPCHLPWETRLKIARGVARGLSYVHEKKHVHGNLKPTNILLGPNMEPKIGDFGLERLVAGVNHGSSKAGGSARNFGSSKRSTASRESFQDCASNATPSPSPSVIGGSPYVAPESLRSLKPGPKWDVFSFGVILLELLTGKVITSDEVGPGLTLGPAAGEDYRVKALKVADVAIRGDFEGKEDALLGLLRLGYSCVSHVPQKRPSMKEVLQALEKFPCSSESHRYDQL